MRSGNLDYLPAKRHGELVCVSGHGPLDLERLEGEIGEEIAFANAFLLPWHRIPPDRARLNR